MRNASQGTLAGNSKDQYIAAESCLGCKTGSKAQVSLAPARVPETEHQNMLECEETKLNISESSADCTDPGLRVHKNVGLCGGGKENIIRSLPPTMCYYSGGNALSPRFSVLFQCVCVFVCVHTCTFSV